MHQSFIATILFHIGQRFHLPFTILNHNIQVSKFVLLGAVELNYCKFGNPIHSQSKVLMDRNADLQLQYRSSWLAYKNSEASNRFKRPQNSDASTMTCDSQPVKPRKYGTGNWTTINCAHWQRKIKTFAPLQFSASGTSWTQPATFSLVFVFTETLQS